MYVPEPLATDELWHDVLRCRQEPVLKPQPRSRAPHTRTRTRQLRIRWMAEMVLVLTRRWIFSRRNSRLRGKAKDMSRGEDGNSICVQDRTMDETSK
jgi:hypothetical protein